jgi:hypothetical protein
MDVARESLECHEHHCVNQNAQLDEKLVEIALQKHRVQLVDVAHLLGPFQSQCDLHDEESSLVVA